MVGCSFFGRILTAGRSVLNGTTIEELMDPEDSEPSKNRRRAFDAPGPWWDRPEGLPVTGRPVGSKYQVGAKCPPAEGVAVAAPGAASAKGELFAEDFAVVPGVPHTMP